MDTRIFKEIWKAKNKRDASQFFIPDAVKALGVEVYDPNSANFPRPQIRPKTEIDHPAFKIPKKEDHPLYKAVRCALFDGSEPFTDGIDQACALTNAVKRTELPSFLAEKVSRITQPKNLEERLRDLIMHGERYDPTLEKLPRRHDPVLFWAFFPRLHGIPIITKNNIILHNLYRNILLTAVQYDQLQSLRCDLDEPVSSILNMGNDFESSPLVIRSNPHLFIQSPDEPHPWADKDEIENAKKESVPDVTPIDPKIDLTFDNIYNSEALLPRKSLPLYVHTIFWSREQDQKYPWTREQNAANAVMFCFGAALAQALRAGRPDSPSLLRPVLARAVQIVDGRLDMVAFQLNTLDLSRDNPLKNIVWIEHARQLYKPGSVYENYDSVAELDVEVYQRLMGLILS